MSDRHKYKDKFSLLQGVPLLNSLVRYSSKKMSLIKGGLTKVPFIKESV